MKLGDSVASELARTCVRLTTGPALLSLRLSPPVVTWDMDSIVVGLIWEDAESTDMSVSRFESAEICLKPYWRGMNVGGGGIDNVDVGITSRRWCPFVEEVYVCLREVPWEAVRARTTTPRC